VNVSSAITPSFGCTVPFEKSTPLFGVTSLNELIFIPRVNLIGMSPVDEFVLLPHKSNSNTLIEG